MNSVFLDHSLFLVEDCLRLDINIHNAGQIEQHKGFRLVKMSKRLLELNNWLNGFINLQNELCIQRAKCIPDIFKSTNFPIK